MNQKDAKQIIQELMREKFFIDNFGGGLVEEALHRAITALEAEDKTGCVPIAKNKPRTKSNEEQIDETYLNYIKVNK